MTMALAAAFTASSSAFLEAGSPKLDDQSMNQAIRFFGVLRGEEISAEDGAWLKQQWNDEATHSQKVIAAQVDDLAARLERHQQVSDPLALANARMNLLKNVYCTAKQTSDPTVRRLSSILAPDHIVLAADCILGLVITRFDIDGVVASHALTAAAMGQEHDVNRDRGEIVEIVEDGFADATPAEKALVAQAELRHAILARFWSRIDGTPEQQAVIDAIRNSNAQDLRGTTRELENLALSKLGDVDYLAKLGDTKLTADAINIYSEWLERIAGFSFSRRDRAWLQDAIIEDFREDPTKTLNQVANIRKLNTSYKASSDAGEKATMLSGWTAHLYCHLSTSGDANEPHLAGVVFRHDPVMGADCQAGKINRKSHSVLAEAGGQKLKEDDLGVAIRFASVMLGRPLLPKEETVLREDKIQTFERDLSAWNAELQFYRSFLAKIDKYATSQFLAMDERKNLFDRLYCQLKASDDPFADDYVEMFQLGGAILFEDCDQQLVTTEEELDAIIDFANFLALINDMPPPSQADVQELRLSLMKQNMNNAESSLLALKEWWSLMTLEEKAAEVERVKKDGITLEADSETIANFVNSVKLKVVTMNARIRSCKMMAIIIQGQTAIYAASASPFDVTPGNPTGVLGGRLAGLVSSTNAAAELCRGVGSG